MTGTSANSIRGVATWPWFLRFFRDPVACMSRAHERIGPVTVLSDPGPHHRSGRQYVFTAGPEFNRHILGDGERFRTMGIGWRGPRDSALWHLRYGLTRMNGDTHRQHRRGLLSDFSGAAIQRHAEQMPLATLAALEGWRDGMAVDLWHEMRRLALQLTTLLLFRREGQPERARLLAATIQDFIRQGMSAGVWMLPFNLPASPYRRMLKTAEDIAAQLNAMIRDRCAAPTDDGDLLDSLLRLWRELDGEVDLLGHTFVLFVGSFENVANTLTWTLFLLAQHPSIAAAVLDEVRSVVGDALPAPGDLERLPLLDAVVKESLRLLPPVTFIARNVEVPNELPDGTQLRPGDRVICSLYLTHRAAELYAQPRRFDPWRWYQIQPGPFEFLPFGAGPRICIGKTLATVGVKLALATLLSRWRISVYDGAEISRTVQLFTMCPRHGVPATVHRQDGQFQAAPIRGNIREMVDFAAPAPAVRAGIGRRAA